MSAAAANVSASLSDGASKLTEKEKNDDKVKSPPAQDEMSFEYYRDAAKLTLLNTSRTIATGIDISIAGGEKDSPISDIIIPSDSGVLAVDRVSKETIGGWDEEKIRLLREKNEKARHLDLSSLQKLDCEAIKKLTIDNFGEAIKHVHDIAKIMKSTKEKAESLKKYKMNELIERIAKTVGKGIVNEKEWFRKHDSNKVPYTESSKLENEFMLFCNKLLSKILEIIQSPASEQKKALAQKTAAWVEYRINLTDHFMTDSCGKVALIMSTFVCMIADITVPMFVDKKEYLALAPRRRALSNSENHESSLEYQKWERHYISKFPKTSIATGNATSADGVGKEGKDKSEDAKSKNENEKKFKQDALDNFLFTSRTVRTGAVGTTTSRDKIAQIVKLPAVERSPLLVAKFSSLIDGFFKAADGAVTVDALKEMLTTIVRNLSEKTVDVKPNATLEDFFRTDNEGPYPVTDCKNLSDELNSFLKETVARLNEPQKFDKIETIALIHYRIYLQHLFFKDGNIRIALALVTYACIRLKMQLPIFHLSDKMEKYYRKFKTEVLNHKQDAQFNLWLSFYRDLFPIDKYDAPATSVNPVQYEDAWGIPYERALDRRFTIFDDSVVRTGTFHEIEEVMKVVGHNGKEKANDFVVFLPGRMLRHELIIYIKTNLNIKNDEMEKMVEAFLSKADIIAQIKMWDEQFEASLKSSQDYIRYIFEDYFHADNVPQELQEKIKKFKDKIKGGRRHIKFSDSKSLMIRLVANDLIKDQFRREIRKKVEEIFSTKADCKRLVFKKNVQRVAWVIVGGPASGKGNLQKHVREQQVDLNEDGCCIVNPDDYKPLLATPKVKKEDPQHAALVHEESSYITDQILDRLQEMVKKDFAPNILLDVVTSSDSKMAIAVYGGATIYLNIATCPVEGQKGAVMRSLLRGLGKDENGIDIPNSPDKGRFVPTEVVLRGHQGGSVLLPQTIGDYKVNLRLFDTSNGKLPKLVAVIDEFNRQLKVYEQKSFYQFIKKALLNVTAAFEEQAYVKDISGEETAKLFILYLKRNIEIIFMYGEDIPNPKVVKLQADCKVLKEKIKNSAVDKKKNEEELVSVKNKIKQFKKSEVFAVFSLKRGIICRDFQSLQKMFEEMVAPPQAKQAESLAEEITAAGVSKGKDEKSAVKPISESLDRKEIGEHSVAKPTSSDKIQSFLKVFLGPISIQDQLMGPQLMRAINFYLYNTTGDCILGKDESMVEIFHHRKSLDELCKGFFERIFTKDSTSFEEFIQTVFTKAATAVDFPKLTAVLEGSIPPMVENPNFMMPFQRLIPMVNRVGRHALDGFSGNSNALPALQSAAQLLFSSGAQAAARGVPPFFGMNTGTGAGESAGATPRPVSSSGNLAVVPNLAAGRPQNPNALLNGLLSDLMSLMDSTGMNRAGSNSDEDSDVEEVIQAATKPQPNKGGSSKPPKKKR